MNFKLINFQYHIIVYVVILVQRLYTILHIFAVSGLFNKTNVRIWIEFTEVADQVYDIIINVTGNQHKTIFFLL